jgi:gluconate kinase
MIYFIAGASGSGKTAIIENLKIALPNAVIHDFDDIGVPENADKKWRQEATERWLQRYLKEKESVDIFCICGQVVLGEILACPSAKQIDKVNFCLLDVSDFERIQRLKKRNTYGADQNMLNWAAWLRMHHQDPQWEQHVLIDDCWDGLDFSTWDQFANWDNKTAVTILDTTGLSINRVAKYVADWVNRKDNQKSELILNFDFSVSTSEEKNYIDNVIVDYNVEQVPATVFFYF